MTDSEELPPPLPYCDYCEREGHTFASCPMRDDLETEQFDGTGE